MNEKLVVKNFGPIKEAELEIKKVTVFIGPQGSGKSTLAKLVAICKDNLLPVGLFNDFNTNELQTFDDFKLKSFLKKKPHFLFESNDYIISFDNSKFSKKIFATF
jgi:AAA15 family ATPase/GTPase